MNASLFNSRFKVSTLEKKIQHLSNYVIQQPYVKNCKDYPYPITLLSYYIMHGRVDIVEYLLHTRKIQKEEMCTHDSPIYFCGYISDDTVFQHMIRVLVSVGYSIDQVGWMNRTVMYHCIRDRSKVLYLLRKGANPNEQRYICHLFYTCQVIGFEEISKICTLLLKFRYSLTLEESTLLLSQSIVSYQPSILDRTKDTEPSTICTLYGDVLEGVSKDLIFYYDDKYMFYMKDLPLILNKGKNPYTNMELPVEVLYRMFDFVNYCIMDDPRPSDPNEINKFVYYRFLTMILSTVDPYLDLEVIISKYSDKLFRRLFQSYKGGIFMNYLSTDRLASFEMLCAGMIEHIRNGETNVNRCAVFFYEFEHIHNMCTYITEHFYGESPQNIMDLFIDTIMMVEMLDVPTLDRHRLFITTISPDSQGVDLEFIELFKYYVSLL